MNLGMYTHKQVWVIEDTAWVYEPVSYGCVLSSYIVRITKSTEYPKFMKNSSDNYPGASDKFIWASDNLSGSLG